jgi:hypothetical protein
LATSPYNARQSQAIPYHLRANRLARPGDYIETPQGPVLVQVERRLQNIILENGFDHHEEALAELDTIKARISALRKEHEAHIASRVQAAKAKPAVETTDEMTQLMLDAMKAYIRTGDITNIVYNGRFSNPEERAAWQRFTMVDISQVNGRTIHATKTSNGRALGFMVAAKGVNAEKGKAVVLDDGALITAVLPLGKDAEVLSKTFNALYRG